MAEIENKIKNKKNVSEGINDIKQILQKQYKYENENKKQIKIKGAATDWWIGEHCINADNGKTYFTYMTLRGEIKITEIDTKNSNALSKTRTVCRMNQTYSDEHNAPGMIITPTGRIIVAYVGHNYSKNVY